MRTAKNGFPAIYDLYTARTYAIIPRLPAWIARSTGAYRLGDPLIVGIWRGHILVLFYPI
jgi:hypothetical protein